MPQQDSSIAIYWSMIHHIEYENKTTHEKVGTIPPQTPAGNRLRRLHGYGSTDCLLHDVGAVSVVAVYYQLAELSANT